MNLHATIIPEEQQRSEVNGADWFFDASGDLQVRVSPLSDWRYEILLQVHELIEAILCAHDGVPQSAVDQFDLEYDKTHTFDTNAGDDPKAPYKIQHSVATAVERILAAHMKVDWETYDKELAQSYPGPSKKQ